MFSNFTAIMYYVYTVSVNGLIFYVGMTKQPSIRFFNHYTDVCSAIYKITRYLLLQGIICDMEVIHCCDNKQRCLHIETNYIEAYSKQYFLVNNTNWQYWQLIFWEDVKKMPVNITETLHPKINDIKNQTEIITKLWQTI